MTDLAGRQCQPQQGDAKPLDAIHTNSLLTQLDGWSENDGSIQREFRFGNYYQTMAFVNAVAWIAHQQDHHPDLEVGYNRCRVTFSTHSIGGLSENDFICAAKVNMLLDKNQ